MLAGATLTGRQGLRFQRKIANLAKNRTIAKENSCETNIRVNDYLADDVIGTKSERIPMFALSNNTDDGENDRCRCCQPCHSIIAKHNESV